MVSKLLSRTSEVQVYANPMKDKIQVRFIAERLGRGRLKFLQKSAKNCIVLKY